MAIAHAASKLKAGLLEARRRAERLQAGGGIGQGRVQIRLRERLAESVGTGGLRCQITESRETARCWRVYRSASSPEPFLWSPPTAPWSRSRTATPP